MNREQQENQILLKVAQHKDHLWSAQEEKIAQQALNALRKLYAEMSK